MIKPCDICGDPLKDGDPISAIVQAEYKQIPSTRSFAIDRPTECFSIAHLECYLTEDDYLE